METGYETIDKILSINLKGKEDYINKIPQKFIQIIFFLESRELKVWA